MNTQTPESVVVIGGGVVGATTALALAERGLKVTLVERNEQAAEETSQANGGGITPAHSEPWNAPGLISKLVRNLGRADAPYRLSPLAVPGMGLWGLRFLSNMRRERFLVNARKNIELSLYSLQCLRQWRERYGFDYHQTTAGSMQVYFSREIMAESVQMRRELLDGRAEMEVIDADLAVAREPALAPVRSRLVGAIGFPDHESGDARLFSQAAAAQAQRHGAELRYGVTVRKIGTEAGRFHSVITDQGEIKAQACVIAAGSASRPLVRRLGIRLPIYPVRGYSATFEIDRPESLPSLPMLDTSSRFVTLRLGERGLRVAGLADFAGHRRKIVPGRIECLLSGVRQLLPDLADELVAERAELWAGLRPVTPDGVPLLGPTKVPGVVVNAGHGPMGWTMACGSAELTADLLTGKTSEMQVERFSPSRF
jgi:D-amino-acid dehydrogenase